MKRFFIVLAIIAVVALATIIVLPSFSKARAYSGPGISENLRSLQMAKDFWQMDGHTNEWPSGEDIFPDRTRGRSINETFRRRHGELYFINRTGTPPFAYVPKADGPHRGGEVLILTSNGLAVRHQ